MKKIIAGFAILIMVQDMQAGHFSETLLEMKDTFVKRFMRGDLYTPSRGYWDRMSFSYMPSREDVENYAQEVVVRNHMDYLEDGNLFNNEEFYQKESFKAYRYFVNKRDKRILGRLGCGVFGIFGLFIMFKMFA